jgi:pilus assembly protein Flp/PilA
MIWQDLAVIIAGCRMRRALMFSVLKNLTKHDKGATAIEYGLIAALIAVAAIAALQLVGTNLSSTFHGIATTL